MGFYKRYMTDETKNDMKKRLAYLEERDLVVVGQLKKLESILDQQTTTKSDFDNQQNMFIQLLSTFESFCGNIEGKMVEIEGKLNRCLSQQETLKKRIDEITSKKSKSPVKPGGKSTGYCNTKSDKISYSQVVKHSLKDKSEMKPKVFTKEIRDSLQALSLVVSPPRLDTTNMTMSDTGSSTNRRGSNNSDSISSWLSLNSNSTFQSDDEEDDPVPLHLRPGNGGEPSERLCCDICSEICRRAVKLGCCSGQACNECAVKFKTSRNADDRVCWRCGKKVVTYNLIQHNDLRDQVKMFNEERKLKGISDVDLSSEEK